MPGFARYRYSPALIPWLRANVSKYDTVIVNGLWNYATWAAARVLPGLNTPYFVFTHGMLDPWFRRAYPFKHLLKQAFWIVCEGRLMASADAVWFTTEEEMLLAQGQFAGYHYNGEVIGYGTSPPPPPSDEQTAAFLLAAPGVSGRPYLLFLSRIHRKKGCDLLIEAFSRLREVTPALHLVIAGPSTGDLLPKLKALAAKRGVADRIHWPGMLQGDAKWGAFYGAEAFILPSHQENFGIVVAEALACGKPVLITNKVNIWREVESWGAGIVQPDTLGGTMALLAKWVSLSDRAKTEMGRAASGLFMHSFDVKLVVKNVNQRIRVATEARRRPA
jgi:glycosyltransferase involved in cell wall biosynthesis